MKKLIISELIVCLLYLLIAFLNKGSNYNLITTLPLALILTAIYTK